MYMFTDIVYPPSPEKDVHAHDCAPSGALTRIHKVFFYLQIKGKNVESISLSLFIREHKSVR